MNQFIKNLNKALLIAENDMKHSEIMTILKDASDKLQIPITIIGGMAVATYGYPRYTQDVDILVRQKDTTRLATYLIKQGLINLGGNKLQHESESIINLCAEGVKAGNVVFPPPENESGLGVASLELLLLLKTKANRYKDRSDIVELVKRNNIPLEKLLKLPGLKSIEKTLLKKLHSEAMKEL